MFSFKDMIRFDIMYNIRFIIITLDIKEFLFI